MLSKLFFATGVFGVCAFAATTATQTFTLVQTSESFDQTFAFAKFSPALGNLTSIHFTIVGSDVGNATVSNGGASTGNYSYTNKSDLYITDITSGVIYLDTLPSTTQIVKIEPGRSKKFTKATDPFTVDSEYDGNYGASSNFVLTSYTGNGSTASSIDASNFVGSGTVNLVFSGDNLSSCTGASVGCATTATGGGSVKLYYDYTAPTILTGIPEPTTMSLLGTALIALGFLKAGRRTSGTHWLAITRPDGSSSPKMRSAECESAASRSMPKASTFA